MIHELKLYEQFFDDVKSGLKSWEIRKNDRKYKVGDILVLKEVRISYRTFEIIYTGREVERKVTYILSGVYGIEKGYVILSTKPLNLLDKIANLFS